MLSLLAAILLAADPELARALSKLAVAIGTVEMKAAGAADYAPLAVGADIEPGAWIRTGPKARAAIDFADGSELRLHENTELLVEAPRKVELKTGRLLVRIAKGPRFDLKTEHSPLYTEEAAIDLEFHPRVPNGEQAVTFVRILEGKSFVGSKKYNQTVTMGWSCTLLGSQLNTPDPIGNATLVTAWVHPILRERGTGGPELDKRVRDLLGKMGLAEGPDPNEAALQELGETVVPAVAKMMKLPFAPFESPRRVGCARVLAAVATAKSAPELVGLLSDSDGNVRAILAGGLSRVAGKNLGFDDAFWKGEKFADGQKAWEGWVKSNPK